MVGICDKNGLVWRNAQDCCADSSHGPGSRPIIFPSKALPFFVIAVRAICRGKIIHRIWLVYCVLYSLNFFLLTFFAGYLITFDEVLLLIKFRTLSRLFCGKVFLGSKFARSMRFLTHSTHGASIYRLPCGVWARGPTPYRTVTFVKSEHPYRAVPLPSAT